MTTTTPDTVGIAVPETRRPSGRMRFAVAFIVGLLLATIAGAGALYAYDQQYINRVLPGVRIGAVDLSGLDEAAAAERLREAYSSLGEGEIVLTTPAGETTISYADVGRGPDVDAMLAEALAVGREGNAIERVIADARTAIRGVTLDPRVTYDADALAEQIVAYADSLAREPVDASVEKVENRFVVHAGVAGRVADPVAPVEAALADLGELDAPASLTYAVPVQLVEPEVTTAEASEAKASAERVGAKITLTSTNGSAEITKTRVRSWLSFAPTADGGYAGHPRHDRAPGRAQATRQADQPARRERLVQDVRWPHLRGHAEPDRLQDGHRRHDQAGRGAGGRAARGRHPQQHRAEGHRHPAGAHDRGGQGRPPEDAAAQEAGRRTSRSATEMASAPTSGSRHG